jgi:hypothetical protein
MMSWLNALSLAPIALWAVRWGLNPLQTAGLFALAPLIGVFNSFGQRPLAAGLCLLAVADWLAPKARRQLRGSFILTVAIGVHPGSLFLLPGAFLWGLWRRAPLTAVRLTALPVLAFASWTLMMKGLAPQARNPLYFHPFMVRDDMSFPPDATWFTILRTLSLDQWGALAWNRLVHLRHYLWTTNQFDPVLDAWKGVSLLSVLGVVGTVSLLRPRIWRREAGFIPIAVICPLVFHHLAIGEAHAQFHISPAPFFAMGLLIAAYPPINWMLGLALSEWWLRLLWPAVLVVIGVTSSNQELFANLGLTGGDYPLRLFLGILPAAIWLAMGLWILARRSSSGNG